VIVIAKEPLPGRVKTRLQTAFSAEQAASLAAASLADTLAAVAAADLDARMVALDGVAGDWLPAGFTVIGQGDGGLDARLERAFAAGFGLSPGPVLLIGMDTPQVGARMLTGGWHGADAVLGLAPDGGFWAVGLRRPVPGAFLGVPMSTDHTGADQLARLRSLGLSVHLLPMLRDVDTPADARAVAVQAPYTRFARHLRELRPAASEHPLALYGAALAGDAVVGVELPDGRTVPLDVPRWSGPPDEVDLMLLSRCEGAVLDLGCGPGRLVGALAATGTAALGVDISDVAVAQTADRGASVLLRSVEDRLPGEGRWGTVLLADGNIGIGGDPDALLRRCAALLRPAGLLLVEAAGDDVLDVREQVRLVAGGRRTRPMAWARLGALALIEAARRTGFLIVEEWRAEERVFLALRSGG
jgi:rSAM/selenodomain-associated transferase 1